MPLTVNFGRKMRSRAKIINGRWERQIPIKWKMSGGVWRTDMFKSVLC